MLSKLRLLMIVVFVASLLSVPLTQAQDEMMTHTCDSTTILLLFIAEYQYGYKSMMDVSTFEKGQYAPLFEGIMAMMDDTMMEEEMMEENMAGDEMMEKQMMDDMMMLAPVTVPEEDPACGELRTGVEDFLYKTLNKAMMMGAEGSGN